MSGWVIYRPSRLCPGATEYLELHMQRGTNKVISNQWRWTLSEQHATLILNINTAQAIAEEFGAGVQKAVLQ